jgi:CHASE3 domain sensor protein
MTDSQRKRRPIVQIVLLSAGLLILLGISASSIYLVYRLHGDTALVAHTLEVENQISIALLQMRRAESAERGYLLTGRPEFLDEFKQAEAMVRPAYDQLKRLSADNPVQVNLLAKALPLVDRRLSEFNTVIALADSGQRDEATRIVNENAVRRTTTELRDIGDAMRTQEQQLWVLRTADASRTQMLMAAATTAGSAAILTLAGVSFLLVRRSQAARDEAEQRLRELNTNLEAAVQERTADLQEANEEIQRFAYIVSHDLRSPLVNIMGFTSELEELRTSIFQRIASLSAPQALAVGSDIGPAATALAEEDKALATEFDESLSFIKSSIGKMDRLIAAIMTFTREGRREFKP